MANDYIAIGVGVLLLALAGYLLLKLVKEAKMLARKVVKKIPSIPVQEPSHDLRSVILKKELYNSLLIATSAVCAVCLLIAYLTWDVMLWEPGGIEFNLGFLFLIPIIIFVGFSIRVVKKDKRGVIYFYGIALKNVGPGPHFVLRFLMNIETFPIDIQEIIEPGPRDKIFWGEEDETLPEGMVRPIYVTSRSQNATEKRALDVQMQYGLGYYVLWGVSDDVATFRQNTRSIEEGDKQVKIMSLSLIDQIIGDRTTEGVIASQKNVGEVFANELRIRAQGMGIRIFQTGITDINLSHDMARAMRDRAKAKFEAEKQNMETDVQARNILKVGRATAKAEQAKAKAPIVGRAEGMAKMKKRLKVSGEAVIAQETLRELLPKGLVIAGASQGTADLVGTVKAVEAALKATSEKTKGAS